MPELNIFNKNILGCRRMKLQIYWLLLQSDMPLSLVKWNVGPKKNLPKTLLQWRWKVSAFRPPIVRK
jgi:hypothetical protein